MIGFVLNLSQPARLPASSVPSVADDHQDAGDAANVVRARLPEASVETARADGIEVLLETAAAEAARPVVVVPWP